MYDVSDNRSKIGENDCEFGEFYAGLPFWKSLSDEEKRVLCGATSRVFYKKDDIVHSGGAECTGVIFVISGELRAYMLSEDGKEITLYRLYDGDTCMLSASCVLKSVTFDVSVTAESDVEAFLVNSTVYQDLMSKNPLLENFALNIAVERFSDVMWTMQQILFKSLDKRVAAFLYDETVRTGSMKLTTTKERIAKYIGSAREVVSRMLKYFAAEKIIEVSRKEIIVADKARLRKLAE